VAINCAAIPETLLESELFGYERGAFTGAAKTTPGKIETANGGTLMLDEIGDLPYPLQSKLLRFLQERKIERVGGRHEIAVDVRVVCATHQDLKGLIREARFREDLYYRVAEIVIQVPRLSARTGDALLLAHAFLRRFAQEQRRGALSFSEEALRAIERHDWPGNVRELLNAVKRGAIMAEATGSAARTWVLRGPNLTRRGRRGLARSAQRAREGRACHGARRAGPHRRQHREGVRVAGGQPADALRSHRAVGDQAVTPPRSVPAPKPKHFLFGLLCLAAALHCRAGLVEVVVNAKRSVAAVGTYNALAEPALHVPGQRLRRRRRQPADHQRACPRRSRQGRRPAGLVIQLTSASGSLETRPATVAALDREPRPRPASLRRQRLAGADDRPAGRYPGGHVGRPDRLSDRRTARLHARDPSRHHLVDHGVALPPPNAQQLNDKTGAPVASGQLSTSISWMRPPTPATAAGPC
jgi:hypothetical protein